MNCPQIAFHRDWATHPAIERVQTTEDLYVVGDVHGSYHELKKLLDGARVTRDGHWAAGRAIFVQLGDVIDRGDHALPAIDLFMRLGDEAEKAGGRVIVVNGNHEMAFLSDPFAHKARAFRDEIEAAGLAVCDDVHSPRGRYGSWFRERPAAAMVNRVYLSHSGWAAGRTLEANAREFTRAVDAADWDNSFTCGKNGFFTKNIWWSHLDTQLAQTGARQVVFGHDPKAFGAKGEIAEYYGSLIKTDVGLAKGDSDGSILRCRAGSCEHPEVFTRDRDGFLPLRIHQGPAEDEEAVPKPRKHC